MTIVEANARQAKRSRKPRPKHGPKKHPTSIKHEDVRTFPGFFCMTTKKRTNMGSRSPSPEPPEASRGPPGRVKMAQRAPKSAPRAAKTSQAPPRSASGRPKPRPGALPERSCRPSGAQLPPKSSPEASGSHFGPRGSILDPAGAAVRGLGR